MHAHQRIDRYELRGLLGRGAMGRVYRVWDPKLEREVALKLVSSDADEKARGRFHREVCAIAALRHPNIVEIYDYSGPNTDQLYYVMEKLDGDDLFNLVQAYGPMPEPAVAAVGHELCLALTVMHDAGLIHRDLKPENVFLSAQGRVVLTDFGVVKAVRENSAVGGFDSKTDIIGTPGFMAPELLAGKQLGPYTDIFALGSLLFNVITGELPFSDRTPVELHRAILGGAIADLTELDPYASDGVRECLEACLAARHKDRPQSAEQVRRRLVRLLGAYGVRDLRHELTDYVRGPKAYVASARQRSARRLVRELAKAIAARDPREAYLEQRLQRVDPQGAERAAMAQVMDAARARAAASGPAAFARKWRAVFVSALALGLVTVAGAFSLTGGPDWIRARRVLRPFDRVAVAPRAPTRAAPSSGEVSTVQDAAPGARAPAATAAGSETASAEVAAATPTGMVEVRLRGHGSVTIAGAKVSARELRGKQLAAGRYRLQVTSGRKRLAIDIDVESGKRVVVTADPRRGRIQAH